MNEAKDIFDRNVVDIRNFEDMSARGRRGLYSVGIVFNNDAFPWLQFKPGNSVEIHFGVRFGVAHILVGDKEIKVTDQAGAPHHEFDCFTYRIRAYDDPIAEMLKPGEGVLVGKIGPTPGVNQVHSVLLLQLVEKLVQLTRKSAFDGKHLQFSFGWQAVVRNQMLITTDLGAEQR